LEPIILMVGSSPPWDYVCWASRSFSEQYFGWQERSVGRGIGMIMWAKPMIDISKRLNAMTICVKVAMVVGGYIAAVVVAAAVLAIYVATTSAPDRQASAGMYAFGDMILFVAVLGVALVPPTLLALFFLIWPVLTSTLANKFRNV